MSADRFEVIFPKDSKQDSIIKSAGLSMEKLDERHYRLLDSDVNMLTPLHLKLSCKDIIEVQPQADGKLVFIKAMPYFMVDEPEPSKRSFFYKSIALLCMLLSGILFLICLLLHFSTYFNPEFYLETQYAGVIHIATLALAVLTIVLRRADRRLDEDNFFASSTPGWLSSMCRILIFYALINFVLCIILLGGGRGRIRDGSYAMVDGGRVIREISRMEWLRLKGIESRLFSGHWLAFSFYALVCYMGCLGVFASEEKKRTTNKSVGEDNNEEPENDGKSKAFEPKYFRGIIKKTPGIKDKTDSISDCKSVETDYLPPALEKDIRQRIVNLEQELAQLEQTGPPRDGDDYVDLDKETARCEHIDVLNRAIFNEKVLLLEARGGCPKNLDAVLSADGSDDFESELERLELLLGDDERKITAKDITLLRLKRYALLLGYLIALGILFSGNFCLILLLLIILVIFAANNIKRMIHGISKTPFTGEASCITMLPNALFALFTSTSFLIGMYVMLKVGFIEAITGTVDINFVERGCHMLTNGQPVDDAFWSRMCFILALPYVGIVFLGLTGIMNSFGKTYKYEKRVGLLRFVSGDE